MMDTTTTTKQGHLNISLTEEELHILRMTLEMSQEMMTDFWDDMYGNYELLKSTMQRRTIVYGTCLGKMKLAHEIMSNE